MATFCFQCVTSFFGWKKEDLELNFLDNGLIMFKFGGGGYIWNLNSNSSRTFMYDLIMTSK